MKALLLLSLFAISTTAFSYEEKCSAAAKNAAFNFIKDINSQIETVEDFDYIYSNDFSDVYPQSGGQKEVWIYNSGYSLIKVELDVVKNICHVKKVTATASDED